ncbi:hypothetical protein SPRG_17361, partial [Saprolegnia parasitica CBS 223.65]
MGLRDYLLKNRASIDGYIDLHAFAAEVMAPFSDTKQPVGGGLDEKYKTMNTKIAKAMSMKYKATLSHQMYFAYGSFMSYAVREFAGKPSITIEMDGTNFVAPASSIITRGKEVYDGLSVFAAENAEFLGKKPTPTAAPTDAPEPALAPTLTVVPTTNQSA